MKRTIILSIIFILLLAFVSAEKIRVGGHKVVYDQAIEGDSDFDGINDRTSYYKDDVLVFASYDTNNDGLPDLWFSYVNGTYQELAMRDTTGDGKPENVLVFDTQGNILEEKEPLNLPWGWISLASLLVFAGIMYYIFRVPLKKKLSKKHKK